jgi:adenine specific DNA methylase Mod
MYWAIRVAVDAVQEEMPNIKSIIYSDVAVLALSAKSGKYTPNPSKITKALRDAWKSAETLTHIQQLLKPHLYRFKYYEKLGFKFVDSDWQQTMNGIADDLFNMLEEARKAKAARQTGTRPSEEERVWNKLFEGRHYYEWPLFRVIIIEQLDTEFRGDLVDIAKGEVPTKDV